MPYRKDEYVKLLLYRSPSNRDTWVKCLRATADFYGWTGYWPEWTPPGEVKAGRLYSAYPSKKASLPIRGGTRLRICRSGSKHGHPRGMTNCIRVSNSISNALLTELAASCQQPFSWMEDKAFRRISFDDWMARVPFAMASLASHRAKAAN